MDKFLDLKNRQIKNIENGTSEQDAVTVSQLNESVKLTVSTEEEFRSIVTTKIGSITIIINESFTLVDTYNITPTKINIISNVYIGIGNTTFNPINGSCEININAICYLSANTTITNSSNDVITIRFKKILGYSKTLTLVNSSLGFIYIFSQVSEDLTIVHGINTFYSILKYFDLVLPSEILSTDLLDEKATQNVGICAKQPILAQDIIIDSAAKTITIATINGGQTISALNPIRYFTDGGGDITKHESITAVVSNAFTDTTGIWNVAFDINGNLVASKSSWQDFRIIAPVVRFYWNNTLYSFTTTSASATKGATYTNNGKTYTVKETIAGGTILKMTCDSGNPQVSGTLTKAAGTGDATITFSAFSETDKLVTISYEAHTTEISAADHEWMHAQGTIHLVGLEPIDNIITTGSPNADGRNTCFSITPGSCSDDGLKYSVNNSKTIANWNQDLGIQSAGSLTSSNAGLFKIRTNDSSGRLDFLHATRFPFLWNSVNNKPQYLTTLGVATDVTNNYYFVYYVYAFQDSRFGETIKIISADVQFSSLPLAQAHSWDNIKAIYPTMNDKEIRPLYKIINEYKSTYDSAVKSSVIRERTDIRTLKASTSAAASGTVLETNVTTVARSILNFTGLSLVLDYLNAKLDSGITYFNIGNDLKASVQLTGTEIDFTAHKGLYKVLTADTSFTYANLIANKGVNLSMSGNFAVNFGTAICLGGTYSGTLENTIQFVVMTNSTGTLEVRYTISQTNIMEISNSIMFKPQGSTPPIDDRFIITVLVTAGMPFNYPSAGLNNTPISWGDGQSGIYSGGMQTHTYTNAGTYDIIMSGIMTDFNFFTIDATSKNQIIDIPNGGIFLDTLINGNFMFFACSNLVSINSNFTELTYASYTFLNCYKLKVLTPNFEKVTIAYMMLRNLTSIISIPNATFKSITDGYQILNGTRLSTTDYSNIIIRTRAANPPNSITFDGGLSKYNSIAATAHNELIILDYWNITDGGLE